MPIRIEESPLFEVLRSEFEVPLQRGTKSNIEDTEARSMISEHDAANRKGCYIYAISRQNSLLPWYVGKATKSFKQEVFNSGNVTKFNTALVKAGGGKPKMFFIALPPGRGAPNAKAIDRLEDLLIQDCGGQNPDIMNQRKTSVYKICISGVKDGGQGKPSSAALKVRKLTGRK